MISDAQRKKLEVLLSLSTLKTLSEKSLNKEEVMKVITALVKVIKDTKAQNIADFKLIHEAIKTLTDRMKSENMSEMSGMSETFNKIVDETRKANDSTFAGIKLRAMTAMQEMFSRLDVKGVMSEMQKEHEAMMKSVPTKEEFIALIPEQKEITADEICNKLEAQPEEQKLLIVAIKGLRAELDELKKTKGTQIFGGGLSRGVADGLYAPISTISAGIVVYNEVVNGDVQTFTLLHTPVAGTLRVYARGQRILPTTDFTLTGAIITTTDTFTIGDLYADYTYV